MRIAQLSKKYGGIDKRTIDFYTKKGLLKPKKEQSSGYREYDKSAVEDLGKILILREMDYSITEIKRILDDPSCWTVELIEKQIGMLKDNQRKMNDKYDQLIRFAEAMKETNASLGMPFQLADIGIPIDQFVKGFGLGYQWFRDHQDEIVEEPEEDFAQLNDMIISFSMAMSSKTDFSFDSKEVQQIVEHLSKRLQNYYGVIMHYSLLSHIKSKAWKTYFMPEEESTEKEYVEYLSICADWFREAKTKEEVLDFKKMKKQYRERIKEVDQALELEADETIADDIELVISEVCKMYTDSVLLSQFISPIMKSIQDMIEGYRKGTTAFILSAIEYYASSHTQENE